MQFHSFILSRNRHIKGLFTLLTILICLAFPAKGQFDLNEGDDDYYSDDFLRYENHVYQSNVKTVMLHPKGWPIAPPFVNLNDPESMLELHFDVLDSSLGNFMYTLIHCDHNWQPSALDVQEYIDGPPEDFLYDYNYAGNTYQRYIHYSLEIPNFTMRITASGNYLLKVYDSDNGSLVLTRRFCVVEDLVDINVRVKQGSLVKHRYSHQEVDFTVSTAGYQITNPFQDLHVAILQNHIWETALVGLEPRFVKEDLLDYDHDGSNAIPGGNEYRLLDIKNTRFTGQGVERVTYNDQENHAYLQRDKSRLSLTYLQNRDLNGWYHIQNDLLGGEGHISADYVNAHFSLKQGQPLRDGGVYVYGALTDWEIKPEAKMTYNQLALQYESTLYLKQGLYNYIYAYVQDGEIKPDLSRFEGSHFQTENEYSILVYHRPLGWDYDRLIGLKTVIYPPED